MDREQAADRIVADISEVGELTRVVAQRYEGMFATFQSVLNEALRDAETMESAALTAMALADAAVDSVRANFVGQPVFACSKGCSACCHLFVAVPPGITEAIAAHIEMTFAGEERADLILRLRHAVAETEKASAPHQLRMPCPLLGDDGACSIYSVRPLSCRSFTSVSRQRCEDMVFGRGVGAAGVDQNPARYRIYEQATRGLQQAARERGLPSQQQGLSSALLAQLAG